MEVIMKLSILLALFVTSNVFAASKVFFVKPKNNEVVAKTFDVEFGIEGMAVEKAGVMKDNTGHHHIIVDGGAVKKGEVVGKDETHKHFGDGSSKTSLTLAPGKHTLTLQFADGAHKSYGEEMSSTITVEVK
jgi:hypothetical protein